MGKKYYMAVTVVFECSDKERLNVISECDVIGEFLHHELNNAIDFCQNEGAPDGPKGEKVDIALIHHGVVVDAAGKVNASVDGKSVDLED